jgi:hypothetical protein
MSREPALRHAAAMDHWRQHKMLRSVLPNGPTGCGVGWRGRIRTFDLLIQSLLPESGLASRYLSVRRASVGRRIGVSQMPTPK